MRQTARQAGRTADEIKAYMLARSGVEWVKSVPLKASETGEEAFWSFWSGIKRRELGGGVISVKVIDESARLNLSALLQKADSPSANVLDRLFTFLGVPVAQRAAILSRAPSGREKEEAPSPSPDAALFVTLGEVKELLGGPRGWELLAPYVTVVSDGKVNVNRAEEPVLAALFSEGGEAAALAIREGRRSKPFSNVSELTERLTKAGVRTPEGTRSRLSTTTQTVTVWSSGEFADERQVVVAALAWGKKGWTVHSFRSSGRSRSLEDTEEGF
jgi:type II secretory pathway component PulK